MGHLAQKVIWAPIFQNQSMERENLRHRLYKAEESSPRAPVPSLSPFCVRLFRVIYRTKVIENLRYIPNHMVFWKRWSQLKNSFHKSLYIRKFSPRKLVFCDDNGWHCRSCSVYLSIRATILKKWSKKSNSLIHWWVKRINILHFWKFMSQENNTA